MRFEKQRYKNSNPASRYLGQYVLRLSQGKAALCALVVSMQCLITIPASAELFKYVNEEGVTVLDSHIPARYINNGYSILGFDGRVLEVVPRALTAEEVAIRDRELALAAKKERKRLEQLAIDKRLLRTYSAPKDVLRIRDARIATIESTIQSAKNKVDRLQSQKAEMLSQFANIERAGSTISQEQRGHVYVIEDRIAKANKEIEKKNETIQILMVSFGADLKRIKALYEAMGYRE